jgi:multiple sugar transport system substrate-binding protein
MNTKNLRTMRTAMVLLLAAMLVVSCQPATPAPAPTQPPAAPAATQPPAAPAATQPPAAAEEVNLDFVVWTYATDMIQDNIQKFEATAPGVKVKLTDYNWGQYHDTVVTNFVGGTGVPDVLYGSDHWLQEWASAGWIVPLKDLFPASELDALTKDMFPYTLAGMTYNGELYGLPYYADPIAFIYNTRIYKEAGIEAAPETWEDVLEHSRIIKEKGLMEYPIGFGWSQQEPFSIEVVTAMLMSRGDEFFNDNLEPTFLDSDGNPIPNSTLEQHIKWVKTALDEGLMDPESLTRDGVAAGQAIMAGTEAYGMNRASGMAQWQDPKASAEAGNFKMIPNPGATHQTLGFVRFYCVSKQLAERDQAAKDAAWKFVQYFAGPGPDGSWPVVKRWALEQGLGFGPIPLYQDQEIRDAFGSWTDVDQLEQIAKTARARKLSPWYSSWDIFTRAELQRAYLGQVSIEEAIKNIGAKWNELKAE